MSVPVVIPRVAVSLALTRARVVAEKVAGHPNYDGQSDNAFHRYSVGYLGEEAFAAWLEREGIPYEYRVTTAFVSAPPEFVVGRYRIEVKGIGRPERGQFVMGEKRDLSGAIYVAARTRLPEVGAGEWEIVGWFTRAEVAAAPITSTRFGSPVREIPLAQARAPDTLAVILRRHLVGSHPPAVPSTA